LDLCLIYCAPREAEITLLDTLVMSTLNDAVIRTLWSGISRGTERLVFEGRIPPSEYHRMRAPFQRGEFPFPVNYGYCTVGTVEKGPDDLLGKNVFALAPHATRHCLPSAALQVLPQTLPVRRAILAANMETALNAVWDSGVGPGDRVLIIGAGVLGALLAGLCGAIPGTETMLCDTNVARAKVAFDLIFHTSASESGAKTALNAAGTEATVIELSWFGDAAPSLPLGGAFHSKRLRYISSQVGMISPSRRARWDYARRMRKALELLCDPKYDTLITSEVEFTDLPSELPNILAPNASGLATAVRYSCPALPSRR